MLHSLEHGDGATECLGSRAISCEKHRVASVLQACPCCGYLTLREAQ